MPIRLLADARALRERECMAFWVEVDGLRSPAFALRWNGVAVAYLNRCRHQSRQLAISADAILDRGAGVLACEHHGARYAPDTGRCSDGPCEGGGLTPLVLEERDGALWCLGRRGA